MISVIDPSIKFELSKYYHEHEKQIYDLLTGTITTVDGRQFYNSVAFVNSTQAEAAYEFIYTSLHNINE